MKKEFIPFEQLIAFAEIFQNNEIQFAFVKETPLEYEQQHGKVNCRDFLADILHAESINNRFSIYNFSWNPKKNKIDRDATKLVVFFKTASQLQELKRNLPLLHAWETKWKLRKTKILTVDAKTAIIIGSRFYLKKGFAISLYTYLLKAYALSSNFGTLTGNELKYYQDCGNNFFKLLENFRKVLAYKTPVSGIHSSYSDSIKHNYAGFVSVCAHASYQTHGEYLESL